MKNTILTTALLFAGFTAFAQQPWSQRMAETAITMWPDSTMRWNYKSAMVLQGIAAVWQQTADKKYFNYVQGAIDALVTDDGELRGRKINDWAADIEYGRLALMLFNVTEKPKYYKVATLTLRQLEHNPAEPLNVEYARAFHNDTAFNAIAVRLLSVEEHNAGIYKNPRATAWYMMVLVDVLDEFPVNNRYRGKLLAALTQAAGTMIKIQDPQTGLWNQAKVSGVIKSYPDGLTSNMFVYALAKAEREGYLPKSYAIIAEKGYRSILHKFINVDPSGQVNISSTINGKKLVNDAEDAGTFIQASVEIERLAGFSSGAGRTVLLDSYFNNEHHKDITGQTVSYHYKWDEMTNNGFSFLGTAFTNYGIKTATLYDPPTTENLKNASIYIIVDPDVPRENPNTKYIEPNHIKAISEWVKAGGVLTVLNNDTGNAEFVHLNQLLAKFGIQFNFDSRNNVKGNQFEMGAIYIPQGNEIFKQAKKIYMKDIATLRVTSPAHPALTDKGDVIIAVAKYGKGTIFAVGDPWFYNEYTDGRKLSPDFENFTAANDLIKWLIDQIPKK